MSEKQAVRSYFGQAGFRRFLMLLERQYTASREGARGYITLQNIEAAEREALDGFYRTYSPARSGEARRYSVKKFEQLLLESRFELTIPQLLGIMNGEPVTTRREQESRAAAEWSEMIRHALEAFALEADDAIKAWAQGLDIAGSSAGSAAVNEGGGSAANARSDGEGYAVSAAARPVASTAASTAGRFAERSAGRVPSPGYRTLWLVFSKSRDEASRCLNLCLAALCRVRGTQSTAARGIVEEGCAPVAGSLLPARAPRGEHKAGASVEPGRLLRLPVLSAAVTGDAHALDWKYPLGRLFWWGLVTINGGAPALDSEEQLESAAEELPLAASSRAIVIREGYRRGGVADDDLSSQVMLYAPGLSGRLEESILTLRQVERLTLERLAKLSYSVVYMVENPAVFAELMEAAASLDPNGDGPILICGHGRPAVAVLRLLDLLLGARGDAILQYAGDLDAGGLSIAQGLQLRYPGAFRAWRMDAGQYVRYAVRGIPLEAGERVRVADCRPAWDGELIGFMLDKGMKLHQELWIEELVEDMKLAYK